MIERPIISSRRESTATSPNKAATSFSKTPQIPKINSIESVLGKTVIPNRRESGDIHRHIPDAPKPTIKARSSEKTPATAKPLIATELPKINLHNPQDKGPDFSDGAWIGIPRPLEIKAKRPQENQPAIDRAPIVKKGLIKKNGLVFNGL